MSSIEMPVTALPSNPFRTLTRFLGLGAVYGTLAGLVSAEIFILGLVIIDFVVTGQTTNIFVAVFFGQLFGVLPALIVGAVSGLIIGLLFFFFRQYLSPVFGAQLGLAITSIFTFVSLYLVFGTGQLEVYGLIVFVPIAILYILSGVWGGYRLAGGKVAFSQFQLNLLKAVVSLIGVLVIARFIFGIV